VILEKRRMGDLVRILQSRVKGNCESRSLANQKLSVPLHGINRTLLFKEFLSFIVVFQTKGTTQKHEGTEGDKKRVRLRAG